MGSGEAVRHTCSTLADIQRQRLPSKHSNATTKFLWDCWTMLPNGFNPSSNSGSALPQHTRNQPCAVARACVRHGVQPIPALTWTAILEKRVRLRVSSRYSKPVRY